MSVSATVLKRITKELYDLEQSPPEGIRVALNEENIIDIQAIIDGPPETPFEGGSFRVKLVLESDFPAAPPKGFFLTKLFHPNVGPTGDICVSTLKKDWKPSLGLKDILLTIKCLLIVPNPESALNEEAGKLLLENYQEYFKHAQLMTSIHAMSSKEKSVPTQVGMGVTGDITGNAAPAEGHQGSIPSMGVQSPSKSDLIQPIAKGGVSKKVSDTRKKTLRRL